MPFGHVLVAVDFSPSWPALLHRLGHLAGWGTSKLTLVHVLDSHYPAAPAETHRAHYEQELAQTARELSARGFAVEHQVRDGDPALEIVEAATEAEADVILAGSHGHSRLRELFFGNVVLNLARLTDRPLWVEPSLEPVPEEMEPVPMAETKVLLATDGSDAAAAAEGLFERLVPRVGSAIVIHVLGRSEQRRIDAERVEIVGHLETLEERIPGIETRIENGRPATVIARTADREQTDLVVIGKRGHNPIRDILLGSTVEGVCRGISRPVLIVPQHVRGASQ